MYRLLFRLVLRHLDAERSHRLVARFMRIVAALPGGLSVLGARSRPDGRLEIDAFGLTFPSPLGVAAGVDKEAGWFPALGALGFGFVEVGTITARPQPGNERPRVFRLIPERAILNSMGFPNPGAQEVGAVLSRRDPGTLVGVNVGRSKAASDEEAEEDYRAALRALGPHCDYVAINVSSPNTPGLRSMQSVDRLRPLIAAVREELSLLGISRPVLVKIAPDLENREVDAIADLALETALDGIIATNTTTDFSVLHQCREEAERIGAGGVSGPPLKARSLQVLCRLRQRVGNRLVLVSVGGITTGSDAVERIMAGATLVQVYTGLVYEGPTLARRINREIARAVTDAGARSVAELVGRGA